MPVAGDGRPSMPRVALAVTDGLTAARLMRGQPRFLAERGFDVHLIASPGAELDAAARAEGVSVHPVAMRREIRPAADLRSLAALWRALRRLRPDLVNASTPKAGLLATLAATLAGVPIRVYTLRGLRLETTRGARRALLLLAERLSMRCAHHVVCVSESLRRRALELGLVPERKIRVLGDGSSNGVDVERFRPASDGAPPAPAGELGLPAGAPVIGFAGRFTRDKGLPDLVAAFDLLVARRPRVRLLLLGDFEDGDPVPGTVAERIRSEPRFLRPGLVPDGAPYYRLMRVLAFPSYREGFPNAPLEAAASGIPVAGYRATGTVDAVVDGETGTLVPKGDVPALAAALECYLDRPDLAAAHGATGRRRAVERFRQELVWREWENLYRSLLAGDSDGHRQ